MRWHIHVINSWGNETILLTKCFDDIQLPEVLHPTDLRANCPEKDEAKKADIRNLLRRVTFKVLINQDLLPDGNILLGRFLAEIKSQIEGNIFFTPPYVNVKDLVVHSSITTQVQSIRLLTALAAILGFQVSKSDVKQTHLPKMFLNEMSLGIFAHTMPFKTSIHIETSVVRANKTPMSSCSWSFSPYKDWKMCVYQKWRDNLTKSHQWTNHCPVQRMSQGYVQLCRADAITQEPWNILTLFISCNCQELFDCFENISEKQILDGNRRVSCKKCKWKTKPVNNS